MNPIYSRRVRRIPPIVSELTRGRRRRRRVQKGGAFLPTRTKALNYGWVRKALKKKTKTTMTAVVPVPGSVGVKNPMLDLFRVPPTDISYASYRMVPISPFTTGINPVDFQIDPQEDFIDLSRSYFEIQWNVKKSDGNDTASTDKTYFVNNMAHSLFKQISVRLNGTLISPQTDTYAYKAYLETLLNYNRDDGETILDPQCWMNIINIPDDLTANEQNQTHADFKALNEENQLVVKKFQEKVDEFSGGHLQSDELCAAH